jgi:hypothetical protein
VTDVRCYGEFIAVSIPIIAHAAASLHWTNFRVLVGFTLANMYLSVGREGEEKPTKVDRLFVSYTPSRAALKECKRLSGRSGGVNLFWIGNARSQ